MIALALAWASVAAGCADGESYGRRDGGVPGPDAPISTRDGGVLDAGSRADGPGLDARAADAPGASDAGRTDAGRTDTGAGDAGRFDAGRDAASPTGTLDPRLDIPPAGAPVCSTPGASCSAGGDPGVCRFFSATEGRCESCSDCGNLGASCTDGTECDILFACFAGRCTNICPLGTFYCGPVEDCLDVGHPTYGVCRP